MAVKRPQSCGCRVLRCLRDLRRDGDLVAQPRSAGVVSKEVPLPKEVLMTTTSVLPDVGVELREGYAEIGDANLHYVEAGDGPLIVLLHGFPEFWFGWRLQIEPLVDGGLSGRRSRHAWLQPVIEARGLRGLRRRSARRRHPRSHRRARCGVRALGRSRLGRKHRLDRCDEPPRGGRPTCHPQRGPSAAASEGLHHPSQLRKSWYFFFFAVPGVPEEVVHARDWHFFRHFLRTRTRLTRQRRSNATSRRGRSRGQRPG